MTQIEWLIAFTWKGSVLLLAGFAAAALLRRASAASRHFFWAAVFAALLILPAAILLSPQWTPALPAVTPISSTVIHVHAAAAPAQPAPSPAMSVWLLMWGAGCLLAAVRLPAGFARTRMIVSRGKPAVFAEELTTTIAKAARIGRKVRVVESEMAATPFACGGFRPAIVLPPGANVWAAGRLDTVLRHEAAHIARWDAATQVMAHAACCLYWFHPLAWLAEGQLRKERERACDDAVLAAGTPAHEYADDLLELARGLAAAKMRTTAPAMAEGSDLETRIQAMLDPLRNRKPLNMRSVAAIAAALLAVLAPTASFTVHAQTAEGALMGVVEDPSGARVPGCNVVAKNRDGSNQETTTTNAAGEYRFAAIPAGTYALEFGARGFAVARLNASVAVNANARIDAHLRLGDITEMLTVAGKKPAGVSSAIALSVGPIRVGGRVEAAKLVFHTDPVYLTELQQQGVEGSVMIQAVISKEGLVTASRVMNADVDSRLAKIAMDTVTQWRYQPAKLNGQPVSTVTTITVAFTLN